MASECVNLAALFALQIQIPDTKFINLTDGEVKQLMTYR